MFKILEAYGLPPRILQAIKIIYENNTAAVITPSGITEYFLITSGIFQGDTLAPLLFIIVIDYILRQAYKTSTEVGITIKPRSGTRIPAKNIKDLSYADDITLLAHALTQAENLLHNLEKAALQVGLRVNADKTKVMSINNTGPQQARILNGTPLKTTSKFKYLGSQLPDSQTDFKYRKGQAWAAMGKLSKIWKSTIPRKLKLNFFHACVESILLYGSETWTITKDLEQRIDGCYTRLLRRAQNIRWQNHPTNALVYQGLPKLSIKIKKRRLNFAGHCARATDQPVSELLSWFPQTGTTNRGRPATTFTKTLKEDTGLENMQEIINVMKDKAAWKELVSNVCDIPILNPPTGDR